jgi:hypothetical protein
MKAKNSTINVSKTVGPSKGLVPGEGEEEVIAVHKFETEPAHVSVDYALTLNLGNYESAKLSVSVTVPCYKEEIDAAYEFASTWAEERIKQERNKVTGDKDGSGSPL